MAAEEYERFLKGAKPGPDADDARFGLANARLFQGRYDQAKVQFESFLKAAPNHPNAATAWYRVGETAYMIGDLKAAQQALEKFTAENPGHRHLETAWPYLGDVCLRLGDLPKARQAYDRALATYPDGRLSDRRAVRARAYPGPSGRERVGAEGLPGLDRARRPGVDRPVLAPDWPDPCRVGSTGQGGRGVRDPRAGRPRSLLVAESRLNRAEALLQLERRAEAEPVLRALVAEGPPALAAQAAFALGTAQLGSGQPAEALATLDEALKRSPQSPMAPALLFRSAEAALKLGQADEARKRFLKAAETNPNDPWADDALAPRRAAGDGWPRPQGRPRPGVGLRGEVPVEPVAGRCAA